MSVVLDWLMWLFVGSSQAGIGILLVDTFPLTNVGEWPIPLNDEITWLGYGKGHLDAGVTIRIAGHVVGRECLGAD